MQLLRLRHKIQYECGSCLWDIIYEMYLKFKTKNTTFFSHNKVWYYACETTTTTLPTVSVGGLTINHNDMFQLLLLLKIKCQSRSLIMKYEQCHQCPDKLPHICLEHNHMLERWAVSNLACLEHFRTSSCLNWDILCEYLQSWMNRQQSLSHSFWEL